MIIRSTKLLHLCFVVSLLWLGLASTQAQIGLYCNSHRVTDLKWSPDGERLAVMTLHGVLIYDHNFELIRSIEAPMTGFDNTSYTGLVWSPDGEWLILPDHTPVDIAAQGADGWSIANTQTGELRSIISPFTVGERNTISELVWSPDNNFILALKYESSFGQLSTRTSIIKVAGVFDGGFSPISQRFDDVHFKNLRWHPDNTISVQQGGITLFFNSGLEPLDQAPLFHSSWWLSNRSGTWEAAQPDFDFLVRATGQEPITVEIDATLNELGQVSIPVGFVADIIWLNDDERLIGVYQRPSNATMMENPELGKIFQGVLIDATTTTQEAGFLLHADGEIRDYSVSSRGDRITLFRDDIWVELWNPITGERITPLEIPPLPVMDTC